MRGNIQRAFSLEDQLGFAELSGDFNPLHTDPLGARREIYGDVVVHGIHALLSALDSWLERRGAPAAPAVRFRRIRARFLGPVYLQREITVGVRDHGHGRVVLQGRDAEQPLFEVDVEWEAEAARRAGPPVSTGGPGNQAPNCLELHDIVGRRGSLEITADTAALADRFPGLTTLVPLRQVVALVALTRLVGMKCPGLRSIFSGFDLAFHPERLPEASGPAAYQVEHVDQRFGMIRMRVEAGDFHGRVDAFYRPPPPRQPDLSSLRAHVSPGEFSGQTVLILGGSRGLGEVTAKIVAAGGGCPVITYHRGAEDAERIAAEVRAAGGTCAVLPYDAAQPQALVERMASAGIGPSQLYFFPSPKIFRRKTAVYDPAVFGEFARCYVDGFAGICQAVRAQWPERRLVAFYPSSTAIDERVRDLAEYSAAKAAGEVVCAFLQQSDPRLSILVRRLPRVATDQTITLVHAAAAGGPEVMLPVVRDMFLVSSAAPPACARHA